MTDDVTTIYIATLKITKVVHTPEVQHRYPEQRREAKLEQHDTLSVTLRSASLEALQKKINATIIAEIEED